MNLFLSICSISFIDLVLSGDNAVVIALACRKLSTDKRKKAIIVGTIGAVMLRVMLTIIAAMLLKIPYVQFFGGVALIYIAASLGQNDGDEHVCKQAESFWGAVRTILVADFIMSLDNVLAVAALANGSWLLLAVGLAISIPIVVFGSQLLMNLMNKYSGIVYIGMAILCWTAAKMMIDDSALGAFLLPYALPIKLILILGVCGSVALINKKKTCHNH